MLGSASNQQMQRQQPTRRRGSIFTLVLYIAAFLGGAGGMFFWLNSLFFAPVRPGSNDSVPFEVTQGWDFTTIAKKLEEKELIRHWWAFYFLGQLNAQDKLSKIRWGEYNLTQGLAPKEILRVLLDGKIVFHELTVVPGANLKDIAKLMAATTLTTEREAMAAFNDRGLLVKLQVPASSFEGYLAPNTYKFTRPQNVEAMITTLVQEGQKNVTEEWKKRATELGLTWHQVMTLASIIEKETGNPEDRKKIASVFHNRLRIGMRLQSDPTVIYGIPNFNGNLTREDLNTPSLYNTYVNVGLPPTPICSPSPEAIDAALFPEDTEYLYFVSKNDGSSYFSATYREHQQAVKKYQLGRLGSGGGSGPSIVPPGGSNPAAVAPVTPPPAAADFDPESILEGEVAVPTDDLPEAAAEKAAKKPAKAAKPAPAAKAAPATKPAAKAK